MQLDPRLNISISDALFEIEENGSYLTSSGFEETSWISRAWRWLFSWTGLIDTTVQMCAQTTFAQIVEALKGNRGVWELSERSELMRSLVDGECDLSSLEKSAAKASKTFKDFLVKDLGFRRKNLEPPPPSSDSEDDSDDEDLDALAGALPMPVPPQLQKSLENPSVLGSRRSRLSGLGLGAYRSQLAALSASESEGEEGPVVMEMDDAGEEQAAPPPASLTREETLQREEEVPEADLASGAGEPVDSPAVQIIKTAFPLPEEHEAVIREIIETMHGLDGFELGKKEKHLETIGDQIKKDGNHPLMFLAFILHTPDLRHMLADMKPQKRVVKRFSKYHRFVKDLSKELCERQKKGDVFELYLNGFAELVGVGPRQIQKYFATGNKDKQRWQKMIAFLINPGFLSQ